MALVGHVWTAPARQVLIWRGDDDCGRGAVMCLACWCSHCSRLLALMWFARWVLIKAWARHPVDPKKVLPPRRPTDQHHAISTSATRDALRRIPLALALQSCAAAAAITHRQASVTQQSRAPPLELGGADARPGGRRLAPSGPRRSARSCWRSRLPPAWPTCGRAAL